MYRRAAIERLRGKLIEQGLHAIIIPTNDPHFGEYTQDYYKVREWLSGFTGSAGTMVVTLDKAALWTDSRYFVQAGEQLEGSEIELMKLKMDGTPSIEQWLLSQAKCREFNVAVDEALFSYADYCLLREKLAPYCNVQPIKDIFVDLWKERRPLCFNKVEYLPVEYTGEDTASKLRRCRKLLSEKGAYAYIVTACDDVAWLCNIRGTDIEYNPLPQVYAVVTEKEAYLFADIANISENVVELLAQQGVTVSDYSNYIPFLRSLSAKSLRICSASKVSVRDYMAFMTVDGAESISVCEKGGIINGLKAVKNSVELEGFRKAFLYDGVAWCKILKYIDDNLLSGKKLSEYEIGAKLQTFREEFEGYRGESFEPIVAFGANAALPHYSASCEKSTFFGSDGDNFLLMDTGAHFYFGTTDTTRTIPIGNLDDDKRRFYTLTLKGMIALSRSKFPKGTRGASLDILARGPLFNEGVMYFHGTGHGIGHYLCVHEGPQSIRMEENPVVLEPGMVVSNEPAIYFVGRYGVRIENVLAVQNWKEGEFGAFYEFETMTLVPIATSPILPELLTDEERVWINSYNAEVYEKITPLLADEELRDWLKKATKAV